MTTRIGINGFGSIGRRFFRIAQGRKDLEVVGINDLTDAVTLAHLLKYDSNYGAFPGTVKALDGAIEVDGRRIPIIAERDPAALPWKDLGVDIAVECTGRFTKGGKARAHLDAGARRVVISAPAEGEDLTVVLGVNDDRFDPAVHRVISNASCTTNCLAPLVKVLDDAFGVETGLMNTIHSYTNDQVILDAPHKDLRRARAAATNIIPTTTGAAKTVAVVIPHLKGRLNGLSFRVPTPVVSVVDFTAVLKRPADARTVNDALRQASQGPLARIVGYLEEPVVSMDLKGDSHSAIVDGLSTMSIGSLTKVVAWYDNEWGYSTRLVDLCELVGRAR